MPMRCGPVDSFIAGPTTLKLGSTASNATCGPSQPGVTIAS